MKKSCSYPGADIGSDHSLVMMKIKVKHKELRKAKKKRRWNLERLKEVKIFQRGVEERIVKMVAVKTTEEKWTHLKESIAVSAKESLGYSEGSRTKKPWITEEMLMEMLKRTEKVEGCEQSGRKKDLSSIE